VTADKIKGGQLRLGYAGLESSVGKHRQRLVRPTVAPLCIRAKADRR
jgi:hypothetical protein